LAQSYSGTVLNETERLFARDVLAYLAKKGLWQNTLTDEAAFYADKLWRPLRINDSSFVAFKHQRRNDDNGWRRIPWDNEDALKRVLRALPTKCQALLKLMADAHPPVLQHEIMSKLPFLRGDSAVLRNLKAQINAFCKQAGRMPVLAEGYGGSGERRIHNFNPNLGPLRDVTVKEAAGFAIQWKLLT
jgi:hypothetical protein